MFLLVAATSAHASEADLPIPDLHAGKFTIFGAEISAWWLLFWGAMVITGTLGISLYLRTQIHKLPAHKSQLAVAETIFQTCKTYLIQQGRFLLMLFVLIAVAITYYLVGFGHATEYELTDRTMQELRLELRGNKRELPPETEAVLKKLEPVVVRRTEPSAKGEKAKGEKAAATKSEYQFTDKAKFLAMLKSR